LSKNPLKGLKIQKCEPRKKFATDEEWAQVKALATGSFLDLINVIEASGARIQELRAATAANLNYDLRCRLAAVRCNTSVMNPGLPGNVRQPAPKTPNIATQTIRRDRCWRGQIRFAGRVPKTTFVGTLISGMSLESVGLHAGNSAPVMSSGAGNPTFPRIGRDMLKLRAASDRTCSVDRSPTARADEARQRLQWFL
jgi:hypothetical protein